MAHDQDASPREVTGGSGDPGTGATRREPAGSRLGGPPGGKPGRGADRIPWVIALAVFAAYTTLSVFRYLRLQPGSWDLGIYTEFFRRLAHLRTPVVPIHGAGFNLLGDHFQPIIALITPFFRVFPSPVTLLVAQALLTALSVVPVCRAARELTGTWVSRAAGAAYGFSWGLQQMINFDFHGIVFAVPLLACCLSALVRGRVRAAAWWAVPLVLVKEDQGFTVAAIGLVILGAAASRGRGLRARAAVPAPARTWATAGGLLIAWGLAASALEILVIIPHFNLHHQYGYWKNGGVISPGGPPFSISAVAGQLTHGATRKLGTAAMVGLPVVFLALGSPLGLVAAPNLLLRFVSTNSYFWGAGWHYDATLMPVVFLAAVDTIARLRARTARPWLAAGFPRYAAVAMLAVTAWLATRQPLAGLWHPRTYVISPHVRAEDAAMARVPPGTTVEATLSMLAPLAARDDTSWIGTVGIHDPRYLVFDATNSGWSPLPAHPPLRFEEQRHPGTVYRQIFRASGVYVFRRSWPTGQ